MLGYIVLLLNLLCDALRNNLAMKQSVEQSNQRIKIKTGIQSLGSIRFVRFCQDSEYQNRLEYSVDQWHEQGHML